MQSSCKSVDLNCDMGESFGVYKLGRDEELVPYVSSANIACGFHAGDPSVMRRSVALCLRHGVAIGAHPGLPDRLGFGRRELRIEPQEAYELVLYQVGALLAFVRAAGGTLRHVKPHGALYNMAAVDSGLADAIAQAVASLEDGRLVLYGLSGSELIASGKRLGLRTASEVFADRTYRLDGTLTPRSEPNAVIQDDAQAVRQTLRMINDGYAEASEGSPVPLIADTVCLHGDGNHAVLFAKRLRQELGDNGITVASLHA